MRSDNQNNKNNSKWINNNKCYSKNNNNNINENAQNNPIINLSINKWNNWYF